MITAAAILGFAASFAATANRTGGLKKPINTTATTATSKNTKLYGGLKRYAGGGRMCDENECKELISDMEKMVAKLQKMVNART